MMGIFDFFRKKGKGDDTSRQDLLEKIEVLPGVSIARAFALHWQDIQKTKITCVSIIASPGEKLALKQSKFGHYPYLPADFNYPVDASGNFMYPLAQINFSELPPLANFPQTGYLQFYIAGDDELYGLDFDDPQNQKNFKVLFFEEHEVHYPRTDFTFLDEVMKSDLIPVHKPHSLRFSLKDEYVGIGDVQYEENENSVTEIAKKFPAITESLEESAYDDFDSNGHKIGGYAYFTQTDPRSYKPEFKDYILLFQLDSDDHILWGDMGVANFFIHPDDLARKDFSKVMYNWDCS